MSEIDLRAMAAAKAALDTWVKTDGITMDDALGPVIATALRSERERALREAEKKYGEFYEWVAEQISKATYEADERGLGEKAWEPLADAMYNGIMASFRDAILALIETPDA